MTYTWYLVQDESVLRKKFQFIQHQEDERLREATSMVSGNDSNWSLGVSINPINDYRNRYVNIMPYEKNRVHLNVLEGNDYINASYVKVDVPNQSLNPGYYIATQGPTRNSYTQFWQMCYNECPSDNIVIVMVTPLMEHGREKCYPYWPQKNSKLGNKRIDIPQVQSPSGSNNRDDTSTFPQGLTIEFIDETRYENGQYTLTNLRLINNSTNEFKTVHHFYFDQWQDMSKPQEIIPIMQLCRHSHSLNSNGNPIVVHCSAGVGRSGTFIALDHLIHDTRDFTEEHDDNENLTYSKDLIEQIVLQLRSQRMKMVQMSDQFRFIYHAGKYLKNYLEK